MTKYLIFLSLLLTSCVSSQTYIQYDVKAGNHNFKPAENPLPSGAVVHYFRLEMILDTSAYWCTDDWNYTKPDGTIDFDRDYFDWNKGPGTTRATNANNKQSVMIGWRPSPVIKYAWEVCVYFNLPDGSFSVSKPLILEGQGIARLEFVWDKKQIRYSLVSNSVVLNNGRVEGTFDMKRPALGYRWTGTWMGGANNSPGPYGGPAWKDMKMYVRKFKM